MCELSKMRYSIHSPNGNCQVNKQRTASAFLLTSLLGYAGSEQCPARKSTQVVSLPLCQEVELAGLGQVCISAAFSDECRYFHSFWSCPALLKFFFSMQRGTMPQNDFLRVQFFFQDSLGVSQSLLNFQARKSESRLMPLENYMVLMSELLFPSMIHREISQLPFFTETENFTQHNAKFCYQAKSHINFTVSL